MRSSVLHKLAVYASVCTSVRQPWVIFQNQFGWLAPGEYTLELRNGLRFRCRANTADANEAVVVGLAREYAASWLVRLPPRATVIDLGSHIGAFAVLAAHLHPDLTVHAYEPSSENVRLLHENLKLNAADARVVVHRAAASERDGRASLLLSASTDAFHVVSGAIRPGDRDEAFEYVQTRSLASIVRESGVERVDLLKMDIEGSEYAVLESSPGAIAQCDAVLMEWHEDPGSARSLDWLLDYFGQLGFEVERPRVNLIAARRPGGAAQRS